MKHTFRALLETDKKNTDNAYVTIPFDVKKTYGTQGQVKVNATFDNHPYRGVMANMGGGRHIIGVRKDIRLAIGKSVGDWIRVTIEQDLEIRTVSVPAELQKILDKNPKVKSFFDSLSYTNRKEYVVWIISAKKTETKENRITQTLSKLLQNKRNPAEK